MASTLRVASAPGPTRETREAPVAWSREQATAEAFAIAAWRCAKHAGRSTEAGASGSAPMCDFVLM
ncbi:MAG: hypothetical protein ACRD3A_07280 [Terriglobales bacterium]